MSDTAQTPLPEDEISLKDILAEIKLWIALAKKNFFWLLMMGALGGGAGFAYAWFSKPTYEANLTFIIKRNDLAGAASSLGGLSALLGGSTNSAGNSLERIIELAGSERVVGEALLTVARVNGREDLLVNHFIQLNKMAETWVDDTVLNKGVKFTPASTFENLDYKQRKALKQLIQLVAGGKEGAGKTLLSRDFNKNSAIINFSVKYTNEDFAIALTRGVYTQLLNFYTNEAIASTSSNVAILKNKVDSIRNALYATQKSAAQKSDQALGLILQEDRVDQKSLAVKENMLTLMYGEAQKNLEALSFMQYTTRPIFTIIDEPYAPIKPVVKSKSLYSILGFCVLVLTVLIVKRMSIYIKNIASNDNEK